MGSTSFVVASFCFLLRYNAPPWYYGTCQKYHRHKNTPLDKSPLDGIDMGYTCDEQVVQARREAVARLRIRGMSLRAIPEALAANDPPFTTADGKPLSKSTIGTDVIALLEQWRTEAAATIADHQAEQLATLREVQREAWKKQDLDTVLKSHDRIAKLLGSDAPDRHEHRVGVIDEATAQAAFDRVAAFIAKQPPGEASE